MGYFEEIAKERENMISYLLKSTDHDWVLQKVVDHLCSYDYKSGMEGEGLKIYESYLDKCIKISETMGNGVYKASTMITIINSLSSINKTQNISELSSIFISFVNKFDCYDRGYFFHELVKVQITYDLEAAKKTVDKILEVPHQGYVTVGEVDFYLKAQRILVDGYLLKDDDITAKEITNSAKHFDFEDDYLYLMNKILSNQIERKERKKAEETQKEIFYKIDEHKKTDEGKRYHSNYWEDLKTRFQINHMF